MAQLTVQQAFALALQHHQGGRVQEAEALYRQILAQQPEHAGAMQFLGLILHESGRSDVALDLVHRAIALEPRDAKAHNTLGIILREIGQFDGSIAAFRDAIAPTLAQAHSNMAYALVDNGQSDEAIAACRQAIAIWPEYGSAYSNLGMALHSIGRLDEAIGALRRAIALRPDYAEAHNNLALVLLTLGDFQQGWEEYEWLWKQKKMSASAKNFAQPKWDGSPLQGRTLFLYAEQGLGDSIQFIRYVPLVEERGGKVIVECQATLERLFRRMLPNCRIIARGQPLPAFDLHAPLLSLPRIFKTSLDNIPNRVPYLNADVEETKKWQQRLAEHSAFLKVGLAWAGSATHRNDRNRSMKLASFAPLAKSASVHFFSLQKSEPATAAAKQTPPPGLELIDWTQDLNDLSDTAALIGNLDLVIAVDTAVVHLAGAMGKPVWTLVPFVPDWRWLMDRQDSPWYPTMRLFRQSAAGNWASVIARVTEALQISGSDIKGSP